MVGWRCENLTKGDPVAERGSVSLPFMAGVFRRVTGSPVENSLQRARKTARGRGLGFKREELCSKEKEVWLQPKRFGLRPKSQRIKANSLLFEPQEQVVKLVQLMLNQKLLELQPNLFLLKQNLFLLKPKEPGS